MATERLRVILEMAAGQYKQEAKQAASATGQISKEAATAGTSTRGMGRQMSSTGSLLRGPLVLGALVGVGAAIKGAIDVAEEMESQYAITEQVIARTGGAANLTADEIRELSSRQVGLTGVNKALVTEANNVLLTFKKIRDEVGEGNNIFERTSTVVLDVATVMGTSAPAAAKQLGKALNDPVAQLSALGEAGLTFTEQQKDQIKALVQSGDLLSAQKLILAELESQVGGTAAAAADASDKISNSVAKMAEAGGKVLLPFLDITANILQRITGITDHLDVLAQTSGQGRNSATLLAGALHLVSQELDRGQEGFKFSERLDEFERKARKLAASAELPISELQKLRDGLDGLVANERLTGEEAAILADILDTQLAAALDEIVGSDMDQTLITRFKPAVEEFAESVGTSGDRARYASERIKALAAQNRDLANSFLEAADPAFAAASAVERHTSAVEARTEVYADSKSSAEDLARADLEVAETALAAQGALNAFGEAGVQGSISALAAALDVPRDKAAEILETLGLIDGLEVTAVVNVSQRGTVSIPGTRIGGITERAGGGRLAARQPAVVGERGPELWIPDHAGTVIPNHRLASVTNSPTTTTNINVNYPQHKENDILSGVQRAVLMTGLQRSAEVTPEFTGT